MKSFEDDQVSAVFKTYPAFIQEKLLYLRKLIFETAAETKEVGPLLETLKWGEPSYLTAQSKTGSTIRLGWKNSSPEQYAMYFNCKTRLVETFRELYPDLFNFEGNRAIIFKLGDDVPVNAVRHCIALSLTYHRRKHLGLLGA